MPADVAPPGTPVLPDYAGACISNLVPALFAKGRPAPWLPEPVREARQLVLLVLDGLGWLQLKDRPQVVPTMAAMAGGPITSVAPTTTACALASLTLGAPPCAHGVVGYRVRVPGDRVLNVLRWRTADGDVRECLPPEAFQDAHAFDGRDVPVVTRAEFASSGFTRAHLAGTRLRGWKEASGIAVEVEALLHAGEPFVYAYYDGVDKVAHDRGFGPYYDAELTAADRLVSDVAAALPPGAALVVTSDHGQVEVGDRVLRLPDELLEEVDYFSGEGRFIWLHARPGRAAAAESLCRDLYEEPGLAWVWERSAMIAAGWFGGPLPPGVSQRLGDLALVASEPVAFLDPVDTGSAGLRCRHGSLTAAELWVPLLAVG